jgi:hypothetical protein
MGAKPFTGAVYTESGWVLKPLIDSGRARLISLSGQAVASCGKPNLPEYSLILLPMKRSSWSLNIQPGVRLACETHVAARFATELLLSVEKVCS